MKVFRDANSTEWTVFEVRRQVGPKGDLAYLPGGFSNGWLCFESLSAKRRLVQYPERWRELGDAELEKLLGTATPAPRGAIRLGDDLRGDVSPPAEL
jgi:hypothetical protein